MLDRNIVRETTLRLFVACPLPAVALEALAALEARLREAVAPAVLRWARPGGIHLTLKFLGDVPQAGVQPIVRALAGAVADLPGLTLALAGLGTFGDRRRPRVLWLGLEGELGRLAELQRRVETALAPLGFPAEGRPFSPHLTLARLPEGLPPAQQRLLERLAQEVRPPPVTLAVTSVTLVRSLLSPSGATYQDLASFPLTAAGNP